MHRRGIETASGGRGISEHLAPVDKPLKISDRELEVKELTSPDQLSGFECSDPDLDDYLHNAALNAFYEGTSKTHLVYYNSSLVGFFSLATDIIKDDHLIEEDVKPGFDPHNYPAIKIARLATHKDWGGRGIGPFMVKQSMAIAIVISRRYAGCRFITVDAYKERVTFYQKYGFKLVESTKNKNNPKLYFNHIELLKLVRK